MSRLLIIVVIVVVVFWLLRSYRKQLPKEDVHGEDVHGEDMHGKEMPGQAEDMVRCVQCGVHLPKRESVLAGGKYYCSEAHRRLHADKPEL